MIMRGRGRPRGSTPSQMAKNCIKIMDSEVINEQNTFNQKNEKKKKLISKLDPIHISSCN